ncbi:MAG TPA: glycoside hydrolase family 44 protein, partial [Phycisphaerae bacterium]|nr:glycoside hydrolase family 44 protein [Phycisphaerae bacterium]
MRAQAIALSMVVIASALLGQNAAVTISVDANANRHPINPNIYGVAYGDASTLPDLNAPLNRMGGNNTSRYNWQINADNRGADWYFESIGESSAVSGDRGDQFISLSKAAGAQALMTIPMIDWIATLGTSRAKLASFSIKKYGAQTDADWSWFPDAGNGISAATGQYITGNNPADANVANSSSFQSGWVQHLVSRWGTAANGGLRYYILDNEHSIWFSTHRDVHPAGPTMDEIKAKMLDYANMIKSIDGSALIVGPEEWGYSAYFYSGYDQQTGGSSDRAAHGNMDYMPWLLDQLHKNPVAGGKPALDVFSLHYYPQAGETGTDTSQSMQLIRNATTRSLWDPNYKDPSWIGHDVGQAVYLIPRMKAWVNAYFPGLPIAITEYNWGAENHINGATTQADIYGIFGREGLDMATRWTTPDPSTPTYKAMKLYRNYDGNKSTFGDVSISAGAPNPDQLSAFAAVRSSDSTLTLMVINKISGSTRVNVNLANFSTGGTAQVWQLTSANTISRITDVTWSQAILSTTVPGQSITLFILPGGGPVNQPPNAVISAIPTSGTAPLTVSFSGTGSSDPDGSIASYAWAFGDGATATGATASHTYQTAGTYTAKLTVTDNGGATASTTVTITVAAANQPPKAVISATPASGAAPLAVSFNGTGSSDPDGSIASYAWAFGDGATATGATASHT